MKSTKILILMLFAVLLMPFALASIDIEKTAVARTIVKEFNTPAIFDITITNHGGTNNFVIDNMLGLTFQPSGYFEVGALEEKIIRLEAYFSEKQREKYSGSYDFAYYIGSQNGDIYDDTLNINVVSFKEAIDAIVPEKMTMKDDKVIITIVNKESLEANVNVKIESELFGKQEEISLKAYEKKNIEIELDENQIWKDAGTYPVKITLSVGDYNLELDKTIHLDEYPDVFVEKKEINLLFFKKLIITKTLTGNVVQTVKTSVEKNAFEKAFTSFNTEPSLVEEKEGELIYTWEKNLGLGESLIVESTTNFIWPLILLLLIGGGSIIYVSVNKKDLVIRKRAIKVRTNTGDFAVKVVLAVKNLGKRADNVEVIDHLPPLSKLYERFGTIQPNQIEKNKIIYRIPGMEKGDKAVFSYITYSDIKFVGRRTLPAASALYTVGEGEKAIRHVAKSNEVFIMS